MSFLVGSLVIIKDFTSLTNYRVSVDVLLSRFPRQHHHWWCLRLPRRHPPPPRHLPLQHPLPSLLHSCPPVCLPSSPPLPSSHPLPCPPSQPSQPSLPSSLPSSPPSRPSCPSCFSCSRLLGMLERMGWQRMELDMVVVVVVGQGAQRGEQPGGCGGSVVRGMERELALVELVVGLASRRGSGRPVWRPRGMVVDMGLVVVVVEEVPYDDAPCGGHGGSVVVGMGLVLALEELGVVLASRRGYGSPSHCA